ncbi:MAG: prepilin-type N-terminal cleavage/methylation domain-containing protein [Candidatus Sumerlaeia bacterium]|nr:prepilin-type N-terminal cleavage/methylation domain-containing protein [Candidatus Sumerlaeia bacterium]
MMHRNLPSRRSRWGLSLVEILITMAIVSIAALGTISALIFAIRTDADFKQRNGAFRQATSTLETTKKALFGSLQPRSFPVVVDSRGNLDASDDVMGTATLQYFSMDGSELASLPTNRQLVRARVTVTWTPPGTNSARPQSVFVESLLAP